MTTTRYTIGHMITDNVWGDVPTTGEIIAIYSEIIPQRYDVRWEDGTYTVETEQSIQDLEDGN